MNKLADGQGYICDNSIHYDDYCIIPDKDLDKMIRDKEMYQKQGIKSFEDYQERVLQRQSEIDLQLKNTYNARLLNYPTGQQVTLYGKAIHTGIKNENLRRDYKNKNRTKEQIEHSIQVSLGRTKNNIYNIARSYKWKWFITLTFDRDLTDAKQFELVTKRLRIYLNNLQKRKCPNLKYLIVPELHKDKENYHFHGLITGCNELEFVFSGKFDKKNIPIFNIPSWTWGFTTATLISDTNKASGYITKYVTKTTEQYLFNKRRYFSNCKKTVPEKLVVNKADFLEMYADDISHMKTVSIPQANQKISYVEMNY